jgi:hypothetical protein
MNDADLDELIAATASVSDDEIARWDLADDDLDEEIMSARTAPTPDLPTPDQPDRPDAPGPVADVPAVPAPEPARSRRWPVVVAAAAVAAVAVVIGTTTVLGPTESRTASTVGDAAERPTVALDGSSRAEVRSSSVGQSSSGQEVATDTQTEIWEYADGDVSITVPRPDPWPELVTRLVDGEVYRYVPIDGIAPGATPGSIPDRYGTGYVWVHSPGLKLSGGGEFDDPRTLLDHLGATSSFEEVGTDAVDGVETRHLRATDPAATLSVLAVPGAGRSAGTKAVSALDVWVDGDDIVRQIDVVSIGGNDRTDTRTIRFYDFDAPITIEAPAHFEELG